MLILITHVVLALSSIILSGLSYIKPSQARLNLSYGLVAGTLASGTYLVISTSSGLLPSCVTGLAYLAIVSLAIFAAKYKLATINSRISDR